MNRTKLILFFGIILFLFLFLISNYRTHDKRSICEEEYKFCKELSQEDCLYYQLVENRIPPYDETDYDVEFTQENPGPGHCLWNDEENLCEALHKYCD